MKTGVAIITALGLLYVAVSLALAEQTDFSGTWVLDQSKSEISQLGQGSRARDPWSAKTSS